MNNKESENTVVSLAILFRIIFGGILAITISPVILLLHALLFMYFILSMCVLLLIAALGSPAILFSKDLKDILRKNLSVVYKKTMNTYKNMLRELTEQHIKSAFLWGKMDDRDKSEKYGVKYIDFIITNAPYIGIIILVAIVLLFIIF